MNFNLQRKLKLLLWQKLLPIDPMSLPATSLLRQEFLPKQ